MAPISPTVSSRRRRRDSKFDLTPAPLVHGDWHDFHECPQKSQAYLVVQRVERAVIKAEARAANLSAARMNQPPLSMSMSIESSLYSMSSFGGGSPALGGTCTGDSPWVDRIVACSPSAAQIFQTPESELINQPAENFVQPVEPPKNDAREEPEPPMPPESYHPGRIVLAQGFQGLNLDRCEDPDRHPRDSHQGRANSTRRTHWRTSAAHRSASQRQLGSKSLASSLGSVNRSLVLAVCCHTATADQIAYWTGRPVSEWQRSSPSRAENTFRATPRTLVKWGERTIPGNPSRRVSSDPPLATAGIADSAVEFKSPSNFTDSVPQYQIWFLEDITTFHMLSALGPPANARWTPLRQRLQRAPSYRHHGRRWRKFHTVWAKLCHRIPKPLRQRPSRSQPAAHSVIKKPWHRLRRWLGRPACIMVSRTSVHSSRMTITPLYLAKSRNASTLEVQLAEGLDLGITGDTITNLTQSATMSSRKSSIAPSLGSSASPLPTSRNPALPLYAGKPYSVVHVSEFGHILQAYPLHGSILGRALLDLNGASIFSCLHPQEAEVVSRAFSHCAHIGKQIGKFEDDQRKLRATQDECWQELARAGISSIQQGLAANHSAAYTWQQQQAALETITTKLSGLRQTTVVLRLRWKYAPGQMCANCVQELIAQEPALTAGACKKAKSSWRWHPWQRSAALAPVTTNEHATVECFEWCELLAFPLFARESTQFVCTVKPTGREGWSTSQDVSRCPHHKLVAASSTFPPAHPGAVAREATGAINEGLSSVPENPNQSHASIASTPKIPSSATSQARATANRPSSPMEPLGALPHPQSTGRSRWYMPMQHYFNFSWPRMPATTPSAPPSHRRSVRSLHWPSFLRAATDIPVSKQRNLSPTSVDGLDGGRSSTVVSHTQPTSLFKLGSACSSISVAEGNRINPDQRSELSDYATAPPLSMGNPSIPSSRDASPQGLAAPREVSLRSNPAIPDSEPHRSLGPTSAEVDGSTGIEVSGDGTPMAQNNWPRGFVGPRASTAAEEFSMATLDSYVTGVSHQLSRPDIFDSTLVQPTGSTQSRAYIGANPPSLKTTQSLQASTGDDGRFKLLPPNASNLLSETLSISLPSLSRLSNTDLSAGSSGKDPSTPHAQTLPLRSMSLLGRPRAWLAGYVQNWTWSPRSRQRHAHA
ncbi:hypothetical protein H4R35_002808 [Dimargaris xerosporica]|nr:hypothetical protein H4R35_002808 [Dimargaris xerosporica]